MNFDVTRPEDWPDNLPIQVTWKDRSRPEVMTVGELRKQVPGVVLQDAQSLVKPRPKATAIPNPDIRFYAYIYHENRWFFPWRAEIKQRERYLGSWGSPRSAKKRYFWTRTGAQRWAAYRLAKEYRMRIPAVLEEVMG